MADSSESSEDKNADSNAAGEDQTKVSDGNKDFKQELDFRTRG